MLWALLFTLLLNNDPVFILTDFDKDVKKHITDEVRKDEILVLRKESKKQRKVYTKEKRKHLKNFNKLNKSRNASLNEFNELLSKKIQQRNQLQDEEIIRFIEVRKKVTENEWENLLTDIDKVDEHQQKNKKKEIKILNKQLSKTLKKVNKSIADESKKDSVITEIKLLHTLSIEYINQHHVALNNMEKCIVSKDVSKEMLFEAIQPVNDAEDNLYYKAIESHFIIIDQTNEKEWKKLMKEIFEF